MIFLITFYLGYSVGRQYQAITDAQDAAAMQQSMSMSTIHSHPMTPPAVVPPGQPSTAVISSVTFKCDANKIIAAQFREYNVTLELSDGRSMTIPHAISADGARYANADESFVFWTRGRERS